MIFSSIPFLYYYLPIVILIYYLVPVRFKNFILLLASLIFYAWGEPKYVLFMMISVLQGYVFGLLIEKNNGSKRAKLYLSASAVFSLGMLGYFKYVDFFIESVNQVTGLSIPLLKIGLPIGISFYTFQILSYVVDIYRGQVKAQRNLIHLAAYITMFPQLIAGPIVRYTDIEKQLTERTHTIAGAAQGIRRFIFGLAKKILLANTLYEFLKIFRESQDKSVLFFWIYAAACALHIYFDFSGYSDMAIGLGKLFGFDFVENFNYPFASGSITEFWRRWHMSLGSWFRDYVYIPLGGNRVSQGRWVCNLLVVWMLTGLWHGAAWTYVAWGLYFGILLLMEKKLILKYIERLKVFRYFYVVFLLLISFVIFDAASMQDAFSYLAAMFGAGKLPLVSGECLYYLKSYGIILLISLIGALPLMRNMVLKLKKSAWGERTVNLLEPVVLIVLLVAATASLVNGSFNPFLYFRF